MTGPGVVMKRISPIRVFSVDNHPLIRRGIEALINNQPDMVMVGQATTGQEAIQGFSQCRPDVTVMELRLPDISGIDAMAAIRADFPNAGIIVLSVTGGDVKVRRALDAGASGYMLKTVSPDELVEGIRQVHAGRKRISSEIASVLAEHLGDDALTEREIQVLRSVANGNRNREIAELLGISELTVKVHLSRILDKLGAADRTQAVTIAISRGVIDF